MISENTNNQSRIFPNPEPSVVMTVDVEDYFMSPESIRFEDWPSFPSRIQLGMERCLRLFDDYGVKATFFFVGWLAERFPEIVLWTLERGHEIATHTYNHTYVHVLNELAFEESVKRSLEILRHLCPGVDVIGHRAPAFSLDRKKEWQFDVLKRNGILYDSSITPHRTYLYGEGDAPRHPYLLHGLTEIPPAVIEVMGKRMPVGGGGTLRILPSPYLKWARRKYLKEGYPPVIYLHPWELVPDHPRISLPWKQQIIHWWGIGTVEKKLRELFENYKVITMGEYFEFIRDSMRQDIEIVPVPDDKHL